MASFKTIEVDEQGCIIKIRNRFTAELAANGQGHIWPAQERIPTRSTTTPSYVN